MRKMIEAVNLKQLISDFLEFSRFEQREYLPLFFLFEKLVIWRHGHEEAGEIHTSRWASSSLRK